MLPASKSPQLQLQNPDAAAAAANRLPGAATNMRVLCIAHKHNLLNSSFYTLL